MSLKRALYKPAPQDNVGTADRRKPLAQGRLVSKHGSAQQQGGVAEISGPPDLQWDVSAVSRPGNDSHANLTATLAHSPKGSQAKEPRRNLSALMRTDVSGRSELSTSPRRETPHVSVHQSPKPLQPSMSLELSDTDTDMSLQRAQNQTTPTKDKSRVLLVDASRQTKTLNDSEVDIKLGFEHSPVKVICHSPSRVHGDLRDTGNVHQASQVAVDHMPTVSILAEGDSTQSTDAKCAPLFKSPLVINEKKNTGSPENLHHSFPRSNVVQSLTSRLLQESDDPNGSHVLVGHPRSMVISGEEADVESLVGSNISGVSSISGISSIQDDEDHVSSSKDVKNILLGLTTAPGAKAKSMDMRVKKKKVGRMPESRYKQAAASAASKGPMKATDRTILTKSNLNMKKTSGLSTTTTRTTSRSRTPGGAKTPSNSKPNVSQSGSTKRVKGSSSVHFSTTPETRGKGAKSSTPTAEGVAFASQGVDVSVIAPMPQHHHSSVYGTPTLSDLNSTGDSPPQRTASANMARLRGKRGSSQDRSRNTTTQDHSSTQDSITKQGSKKALPNLEALYARYFQWVFLESKAEKIFQKQEKNVMAQFYTLLEENEKMAREKAKLELQLARLKKMNALDETLEIQQSGLGPVATCIPQLGQEMLTLSQSLDTTRHQIAVKGVHIPDNSEAYEAALLSALQESEQLLGELSVMCRQPAPKVNNFAKQLKAMENTVEEESKELSKCLELLAATQSLSTQETSLLVQDMQK